MRSFIASLILLSITSFAHAEYYIACHEPVLNVVTINCRGHHCRFSNRHAGQPDRVRRVHHHHHAKRHHHYHHMRHYYQSMGCDLDGATGDDDPCVDPNMQIN